MTRARRRLLLAGGVLLLLGVLAICFQPVRVVGRSMEPTLAEGDWLFVSRGEPGNEDLVVFREPGSGKLAVKRVAGTPGQRVLVRDGALLVDGEPPHRALAGVEELVPMADAEGAGLAEVLQFGGSPFREQDGAWVLPEAREALAFLHRPPREDYLMRGTRIDGTLPAADLGIEVAYRLLGADARLEVALRKGRSTFTAVLDQGGRRARILREEPDAPPEEVYATGLPGPHEDGVLFFTLARRGITLCLDGRPLAQGIPYPQPSLVSLVDVPMEFARVEHAGVGGRGPLQVARVRLGRGVYYDPSGTYGVGEALQLADDQYFLLGDNPSHSRDSRHYGAVGRDRILGVVAWRAWPGGWTTRGWPLD